VIVSWNYDVSYVYKVYWSTAPGVVKSSANRLLDGGGMNNYTHTGLTNGTTYYYVVTAAPMSSPGGSESVASVEVSATPQAGATIPVTGNASSVTDTSATINGSFTNPSGYTTTAWLEYGPTTAYGSSSGQTAYMQTGSINITASLTGLTEHTTYHYRTATQNSGGTFYGADSTFTTLYTARTLASGLTQPYRIAYDASSSSLFFTQNTSPNGTISMVSTSGTNSATAVISSLINPTLLAVDSTNVYWIEGSSSYQLKKAPKSGGTPTTLSTGLSSPYAIAVDSSSVYWTENVASGGGAVKKVSINGGTVVVLAAGLTYPRGLAIDFLSVYWVESYQSIKKIGINGGTVTVLVGLSDAADLISPSIALYQSYVYYSRYMSGEGLYRVSINGGSSTAIVSGSAGNIPNFVLDGSNVYSTGSSVGKVSLTDGTITQLSLGAAMSQGVVDPTNVYWADQVGGRIQYVPKN